MNAAAEAFSLPFVPQKEAGLGQSPNAQRKAKQRIKKEKPSGKADQNHVKNSKPQPKQAKPFFG